MTTLYDEMLAADLVVDSHESDLYVLDTPEARAIIKKYPQSFCSYFTSRVDKRRMIDIAFAYQPYWDKRFAKSVK